MKFITGSRNLARALGWLLLLLAIPAQALSPVWMVEKDGKRMFFGGTLHILTAENYPLPKAFETAYAQSGQVVFETDITKMEDPAFQQYLLREVSYSDGRSLRQVLRADTYSAVAEFFDSRGVPMTGIDNFKPGMVATLMTVVELQRLGVNADGVDAHFNRRADLDQKQKGQLETAEEQIAFLANLGAGQEDLMVNYSLADIERLPELWRDLTQAWLDGDLAWLEQEIAQPMRSDFPSMYQSLVVERNRLWIPQLVAMSKTEQVEFVLVGALHLSGKEGLLARLAAQGYRITRLP
jgi:uncharacterized protein YbaP (TraB family)